MDSSPELRQSYTQDRRLLQSFDERFRSIEMKARQGLIEKTLLRSPLDWKVPTQFTQNSSRKQESYIDALFPACKTGKEDPREQRDLGERHPSFLNILEQIVV